MEPLPSEEAFKHLLLRMFDRDRPMLQRLYKTVVEDRQRLTLRDLLREALLDREPDQGEVLFCQNTLCCAIQDGMRSDVAVLSDLFVCSNSCSFRCLYFQMSLSFPVSYYGFRSLQMTLSVQMSLHSMSLSGHKQLFVHMSLSIQISFSGQLTLSDQMSLSVPTSKSAQMPSSVQMKLSV